MAKKQPGWVADSQRVGGHVPVGIVLRVSGESVSVVRSTGPILEARSAVSVGFGQGVREARRHSGAGERGERESEYSPDDTVDAIEARRARRDANGLGRDRKAVSECDCVRELGACLRAWSLGWGELGSGW